MESACVSASCAHGDMWCAELRCAIKDSQADKVWEAYGRGGACSCVRNSGTYGDNNVHGILSLIFLSRKTSTHPHTYICTPIKEDQRTLSWKQGLGIIQSNDLILLKKKPHTQNWSPECILSHTEPRNQNLRLLIPNLDSVLNTKLLLKNLRVPSCISPSQNGTKALLDRMSLWQVSNRA